MSDDYKKVLARMRAARLSDSELRFELENARRKIEHCVEVQNDDFLEVHTSSYAVYLAEINRRIEAGEWVHSNAKQDAPK